ncbi:MAG: N-acetylneuraminate synthase family protein [Chitinophagaceae bacterium]|nr:N-acetylneuraminate synthase family protein [Chitinophagaceae bacterium]
MIINKNIKQYLVPDFATIKEALKVIDQNHNGYVLVVDEGGVLEGVLTDGDYRRWSLEQAQIDLNIHVSTVCRKDFQFAFNSESNDLIEAKLSSERKFVPIVDEKRRIVAVAEFKTANIGIANFLVTETSPCFIIAEIGLNHNGSLERAFEMIKLAADTGVDCVKFQMRNMSSLYLNKGNSDDIKEDLGSQYVLDLLAKFQLTDDDMYKAFDYCKSCGVIPMCTPWDSLSLESLEKYGMDAYKVASADFTNHDFLKELAKTGKTLICSTGMCSELEIIESVKILKKHSAKFILLQCNSTYPTPYKDVNLKYIQRLKDLGDCFVGYSGHERGYHVVLASIALGAKVVEKHFTLDKNMEGNDHKVSLLPEELKEMVQKIKDIEQSLGTTNGRIPTQGELMNRNTLAKSLVAGKMIKMGQIISEDMIVVKAPGKGLQPNKKKELIGKVASRNFDVGDFFYETDVTSLFVYRKHYRFRRPWGVAVRFHDYKELMKDVNPDFIEFHLSYKDLYYDVDKNFFEKYDLNLVVHSPDTFEGDFLLDLSNPDENHRCRSIVELQKTIDITRKLKRYFNKAHKPLIVVSLGGFSTDGLISKAEQEIRYTLMADSLRELDTDGVEVIGQTLPPYPWYFGGQLYLNLFVTAEDTVDFCKKNNLRLCFDISHSKLTCNELDLSFNDFVQKVAPYAAHLHIADAKGVDGEGLQIGDGEIDFFYLAEQLDKMCPEASFIPEIWQGHKNAGEGFWLALQKLEKYF